MTFRITDFDGHERIPADLVRAKRDGTNGTEALTQVQAQLFHEWVGNEPPTVFAGNDQDVEDTGATGSQSVTLSSAGTTQGSTPITNYTWTWDDGGPQTANGATTVVTLPSGTTTVTLTVTDDGGNSVQDTVDITVNARPLAVPGGNQTVTDNDENGSEDVVLDGSGSSDLEGTIVAYNWSWTGAGSGSTTGVNPTINLPLGTSTVSLTVTDDQGAVSDPQTVDITVEAPATVIGLVYTPMTGYTGHTQTVFATSEFDGLTDRDAWRAFDNQNPLGSPGYGWVSSTSLPQSITIDLGSAKEVTSYNIQNRLFIDGSEPAGWQLRYSNDGVNFTTLDTQSGQSSANDGEWLGEKTVTPTTARYWRLNFTDERLAVNRISCAEIVLYGPQVAPKVIDHTAAPRDGSVPNGYTTATWGFPAGLFRRLEVNAWTDAGASFGGVLHVLDANGTVIETHTGVTFTRQRNINANDLQPYSYRSDVVGYNIPAGGGIAYRGAAGATLQNPGDFTPFQGNFTSTSVSNSFDFTPGSWLLNAKYTFD